jgi:hypothetical protein
MRCRLAVKIACILTRSNSGHVCYCQRVSRRFLSLLPDLDALSVVRVTEDHCVPPLPKLMMRVDGIVDHCVPSLLKLMTRVDGIVGKQSH